MSGESERSGLRRRTDDEYAQLVIIKLEQRKGINSLPSRIFVSFSAQSPITIRAGFDPGKLNKTNANKPKCSTKPCAYKAKMLNKTVRDKLDKP